MSIIFGGPIGWSGVCYDPVSIRAMAGAVQAGSMVAKGYGERNMARAEGDASMRAAEVEAAGLRERAKEERAAANYAASERREAAEKVMGRQVALAAASGGGTGGTILDIIGETAARGELQAQGEKYKGEQVARGLESKAELGTWQAGTRAKALRQKGDAAFTGSIFEGAVKGMDTVYKYGEHEGLWKREEKPDSDETDPRTGWRTRVYKAKR